MIRITGHRINSGERFETPARSEEPYEALRSLAVYELGYGGRLTNFILTDNQAEVTVRTNICNCVDTTVFSGTREEMEILLQFLGCYAAIVQIRDLDRMSQEVLDMLGNSNTLIITHLGPMLMGMSEIFSALVVWAELDEDQVELAQDVVSHNTRSGRSGLVSLIEVIEFVRELGVSFEDACREVGGTVMV